MFNFFYFSKLWTFGLYFASLYSFSYRGGPVMGCKVFNEADRGIYFSFPQNRVFVLLYCGLLWLLT